MDFKDQIKNFTERVDKLKDKITTEEATKSALIMPFIKALGYDVFNPLEVVPEFTADVGTKKGEKVDYAILKDGEPIILVECKHWGEDLIEHGSQLFRYFAVTKAKFAILTNGIEYRFFSDLEEENKMDEKPFLIFNVTEMKDPVIQELRKFHKSYFNIDEIINTSAELKLMGALNQVLRAEFKNPSPEFVRFFGKQIYTGKITENVLQTFTPLVKNTINHLISEMVNEKIKAALEQKDEGDEKPKKIDKTIEEPIEERTETKIDTTEIELEGFYTIKAMLRGKVDVNRLSYRDTINYFSILLDDHNRKPVCRLWFNSPKKRYIEVFDENRNGTKHEIDSIDGIFNFKDQFIKTIESYDKG
ncbi:MAG: type I restriction enzyme HsdR N-terminal domain-containing protein [Candidatus Aminicenantes bacterium]|nr:MAG: type I restriction enzyme HsdR N-terminal domain-containing protein [Candidatus Aminicenantes bacterium]